MITNVQIMTWIGINPAAAQNALIADFLSDGLIGLKDLTQDDVNVGTCRHFLSFRI